MIGKRLSELRNEHKLTQQGLAERLNLTRSALSLYELDKRDPDTDTIKIIADYFNVSTDYLLGRTDERVSNAKFINSNIDVIRNSMGLSYEEMAKDITQKLGIPTPVYSAKNLKKLANGGVLPSNEEVKLLAGYAEVELSFLYQDNTVEDYLKARDAYRQACTQEQSAEVYELPDDLKDFVNSSDSLPYLYFAKELKEKGITPLQYVKTDNR